MSVGDFDPPTFNILSIGLDGSGKTLFLAALYNKMAVYNKKFGFSLQAVDEAQGAHLTKIHQAISSPDRPFPPGNMFHEEFIFNGLYPSRTGPMTICKFRYLDFAGAMIRAERDFEELNLRQEVKDADSILVLLDGKKIKNALDGTSSRQGHIYEDLDFIMPFLNLTIGPGKPIHFLITKYDLLNPNAYPLKRLCDLLLSYPNFANFVRAQPSEIAIRLVPVSSLGFNFAKLDEDQETMIKLPGGVVDPVNVQFALSLAIHDYFWAMSNKSYPNVERLLANGEMLTSLLDGVRLIPAFMLPKLRALPRIIFVNRFVKPALVKLFEKLEEMAENKRRAEGEKVKIMREAIGDRKTAFIEALTTQRAMIKTLDEVMPENNLTKAMAGGGLDDTKAISNIEASGRQGLRVHTASKRIRQRCVVRYRKKG